MPEDVEGPARRSRIGLLDPRYGLAPAQDPACDGEFGLVDENTALIAGQVAFRVYEGLLAEQSPVFSSFAKSQLLDHLRHRTPVVHLPDSPEDLTHLRALLPNK